MNECVVGLRGSSSIRSEAVTEPVSTTSSTSRSLPALITPSEDVSDDWLVEDVRGLKRKRPDVDSLFKDINIRTMEKKHKNVRLRASSGQMAAERSHVREVERRTLADHKDYSMAGENFDSDRASPESTVMLNDETCTEPTELPALTTALQRRKQTRLSTSGAVVPAGGPGSTVARNKAESTGQNVSSTTVAKAPPPPTPPPNPLKMRLKVRIDDELILVPVLERFAICICHK